MVPVKIVQGIFAVLVRALIEDFIRLKWKREGWLEPLRSRCIGDAHVDPCDPDWLSFLHMDKYRDFVVTDREVILNFRAVITMHLVEARELTQIICELIRIKIG